MKKKPKNLENLQPRDYLELDEKQIKVSVSSHDPSKPQPSWLQRGCDEWPETSRKPSRKHEPPPTSAQPTPEEGQSKLKALVNRGIYDKKKQENKKGIDIWP